jgi:hypothetical protein
MVTLWTKRRQNLEDRERVLFKSLVYPVEQQEERPKKNPSNPQIQQSSEKTAKNLQM